MVRPYNALSARQSRGTVPQIAERDKDLELLRPRSGRDREAHRQYEAQVECTSYGVSNIERGPEGPSYSSPKAPDAKRHGTGVASAFEPLAHVMPPGLA